MEHGIELARAAARILDDNKADDIKIINVKKQVGITDFFVIATGKSKPHIKFLSQELKNILKEQTGRSAPTNEGTPEQGWLLLDYAEVIIHIFTQEKRDYYNLEGLWADAPPVAKQL
ncbi:MAG: ribosome silencing factor [bacterium]